MTEPKPSLALVRNDAVVVPARNWKAIVASLPAAIEAVASEENAKRQKERYRAACVELVFSYWAARFNKPRSLLDPKRTRLIATRLKESGDRVSDLLFALDGARRDPWVMGTAANSTTKYDGLDVILRDRATLERYAERMSAWQRGDAHPLAVKYHLDGDPTPLTEEVHARPDPTDEPADDSRHGDA